MSNIAAHYKEAIQQLEAQKNTIERTLRGLEIICLAERIREEYPEAKYMAIQTTFTGTQPFESISLENENGTRIPAEELITEIRYSIYKINGDILYPISTMISSEPNTIYIEIDMLVGKIPPENSARKLSLEYERELTLNSLAASTAGLWVTCINMDSEMNVLSWSGNACHDDTVHASQHPETAATLTAFMKSAKNQTRTSGRWHRNDQQCWSYRTR